ncbi:GTP cyclohydrolase I [Tengunoibacter tsumagoiensis]|uniref:GTP cyclohydrolase 1 n=1 Tax=Tengunoibacter tsumagoiensis TaxID=2014871 RepID=A0A402AAJ8_9CHLR|nr:GTP cyclohydrolase I [Tengunoibacter tsumagoiensis]GCE16066.1 GTP cyclohydrolase 1 1 [Tengunoibacter tsumagoiensis]
MVMHMDQERARNNGHDAHDEQPQARHVDYARLLELGRELLIAVGENPDREGLLDTPRRWADWWREFIEYDPGKTETIFNTASTDQMVCVSGMRVFSLCEHHLLPMWCDVSIGYIPDGKVLGLSKFARIAHQFAHQLQIQERLGQEIADEISRITGTSHVAVVLKGEHLCMTGRGIRTPGVMTSSVMRGVFREHYETRMEFLRLIE